MTPEGQTGERAGGARGNACRTVVHGLVVAVLLGAFALQALLAVREASATDDEPYCIVSGLSALVTGDYRLNRDHPPLMNMIYGAAIRLAGAAPLPQNQDWAQGMRLKYSYGYLWEGPNGPKAVGLVQAARLPVVVLSLLLALLLFLWARQLYGWPAAVLPLALYCFEPNLIAHSSVATLDLGITATFFCAVYAFWRYHRTRRVLYLVLAGIAVGVASAVKLPGLLLLVALPLLLFAVRGGEDKPLPAGRIASQLGALVGIAVVVIWAVYRFSVGPVSADLGAPRLPLGDYWQTIAFQMNHVSSGHVSYLLGQTSDSGWWYYYPLAFLVKTSLPLLILLGLAASRGRLERDELFLLVPAAVFLLFTMMQKLDLGIRYILPIYPLLIVFTGRVLTKPWPARYSAAVKGAVVVLAVWAGAEAALYSPNYLAYFNELAGGPKGGIRVLVDSNLDWGQDLNRLAAWQRAHPDASPLYFAYFGPADVSRYGVRCERLPDLGPRLPDRSPDWYRYASGPRSGWIAVSINCLKLLPHYRWLESYRPVDRAGYSILIYHLPARPQAGSVADPAQGPLQ